MLTVESLRKIAQESLDNDEYICLKSGDTYTISKIQSVEELEEFIEELEDIPDYDPNTEENVIVGVGDCDEYVYTEADHAKDWNYFKNTMEI